MIKSTSYFSMSKLTSIYVLPGSLQRKNYNNINVKYEKITVFKSGYQVHNDYKIDYGKKIGKPRHVEKIEHISEYVVKFIPFYSYLIKKTMQYKF